MSLVIRLPVADAALVRMPAPAPTPTRTAPSVIEAEREGRLILLVDDHPTNRAVIARQLQQIGYACETAADGEEGLHVRGSRSTDAPRQRSRRPSEASTRSMRKPRLRRNAACR